jgi:hypothetical protein
MLNLPLELEKMREDIDKSCELYDLLEPFKEDGKYLEGQKK